MAKVVKVVKENMPQVKLVGKKYGDSDRDEMGFFAKQWQDWYSSDSCTPILKTAKSIEGISENIVGAMRMTKDGFEYWIGRLMATDSDVPEGYDSTIIDAGELVACHVKGNPDNGDIYGPEVVEICKEAREANDIKVNDMDTWFYERYDEERFMNPDENGDVILDVCAYTA